MTTKRAMPKPAKMWGVYSQEGGLIKTFETKMGATAEVTRWGLSDVVRRVLVTPIEPRKRGKK